MRHLVAALALAAFMGPSGVTDDEQASRRTAPIELDGEVEELLPALRDLMIVGLETTDPNVSVLQHVARRLGHPSHFQGSYDWHSNLFAQWALLVMARLDEDEVLAELIHEPLTPEALARERALVDALDPTRLPTFPYDQAWLSMFLAELERHLPERADVRDFRVAVEERLLDWLEANPFPEVDDPKKLDGRPFVGFYRSWLFTWLLVRLSDPVTEEAGARLDTLYEERVEPQRKTLAAHTNPLGFDFLWLPAVLALVEDAAGVEERTDYDPGPFGPLPASVSLRDVHVLGVELSRLWGLAVSMQRGDATAGKEYHRRLDAYIERDDLWDGDFTVVSHWIPQFLWFGIWVARGRP